MTGTIASMLAALALQSVSGYSLGDPRIQVAPYDANHVIRLSVADGYATLIELSPDERVESVVVGNSAVWQVTAGKQGDRLVVKPLPGAVPTNMMVVTDVRQYVFMLEPTDTMKGTSFVLRFTYPADAAAGSPVVPAAVAEVVPGTYRLSGANELRPRVITDDGKWTSVTWDPANPMPAVFAVDRRGKEALVNGRVVGERYIIEGVAPRYVFRLGRNQATATRITPRKQR